MKGVLNDGHRFFYLTKLSKMLKLFYAFVRFFHRVQTMLTIRGPFVAQVGGVCAIKEREITGLLADGQETGYSSWGLLAFERALHAGLFTGMFALAQWVLHP